MLNWKPRNLNYKLSKGQALLSKACKFVLDDYHYEDIEEETFLACQQIIHNPMLLDTIPLVISGQFSDFLDELKESVENLKDDLGAFGIEEVTFQPYKNFTVTKDMYRFVTKNRLATLTWVDYRIDHDYMTDFMHKLEKEIEKLPSEYRDNVVDTYF